MAGFEFEVRVIEKHRDIAKPLLSFIHRLGKERQCKVRYRWTPPNHYFVAADGPLPHLQALFFAVFEQLPPCAQGLTSGHSRTTAVDISYRIVDAYKRGLEEISDTVQVAADTLAGVPNSFFFDPGKATHAKRKLHDLTRSLLLYSEGHLPVDVMAEQLHTVAELLLKRSVPNCKTGAFSELVRMAADKSHLPKEMEEHLLQLKDIRRESKHRGHSVSADQLNSLLASLIGAIHYLLKGFK
jgi:hypothetical protein